MLRGLRDLARYAVRATDGDIGSVVNFLLDDVRWTVRYLVVKAGRFFSGREVLISPIFFRQVDWSTRRFELAWTMERVRSSPGIDVDLPVTRQLERDYFRHYSAPAYWASVGLLGTGDCPDSLVAAEGAEGSRRSDEQPGDAHLQSARDVTGYHVHGSDGVIGHVSDFLVDSRTWEVRYLVVDTAHWWREGKTALLPPRWATRVRWAEREVHLDLTRQEIGSCPEWNTAEAVDREYEMCLYRHYGRPAYWDNGDCPERTRYSTPPEIHHPA